MKKMSTIIAVFVFFTLTIGEISYSNEQVKKESEIPVRRGHLEGKLTWRGIVRSANRLEIRSDKKVKIGKVHIKNFDLVKKGQLLIEVDTSESQKKKKELEEALQSQNLDFQSAKVKFQQSARNLGRKSSLVEKGILAMKELEEAQKDYKLLENELKSKEVATQKILREIKLVENELRASNFLSPQDGVIQGLWDISTGNNEVNPGQAVFSIIDPKTFALWVQVEENNLSLVSLGKKAQVTLDTAPGKEISGAIFEISTNANDNSSRIKTYNMGIAFNANGLVLKEGFSGEGSITYAEKENALCVPISAVKYLEGKEYLVVTRGIAGTNKTVPVTVGLKTETEVEILSGVTETDKVLVSE